MAVGKEKQQILAITVVSTGVSLVPTVYVAAISNSLALYADLLRCVVEFLAIVIAVGVARVTRPENLHFYQYGFSKLEHTAGLAVAGAMLLAFVALLFASLSGFYSPHRVESASLGLLLAALSVAGNFYLWQRNRVITAREYSPLTDAQSRLFRAKTFASLVVVASLGVSLAAPDGLVGMYSDPMGSLAIAFLLLYSGYGLLFRSLGPIIDQALEEGAQLLILKTLVRFEAEYRGVEQIRTRAGGERNYIELSLNFDGDRPLKEIQTTIDRIRAHLEQQIPGALITVIPIAA